MGISVYLYSFFNAGGDGSSKCSKVDLGDFMDTVSELHIQHSYILQCYILNGALVLTFWFLPRGQNPHSLILRYNLHNFVGHLPRS